MGRRAGVLLLKVSHLLPLVCGGAKKSRKGNLIFLYLGHYQFLKTFASYPTDPTEYNNRTVIELFEKLNKPTKWNW